MQLGSWNDPRVSGIYGNNSLNHKLNRITRKSCKFKGLTYTYENSNEVQSDMIPLLL
jgi:hypothetical protein